jgi:hypothetical protein
MMNRINNNRLLLLISAVQCSVHFEDFMDVRVLVLYYGTYLLELNNNREECAMSILSHDACSMLACPIVISTTEVHRTEVLRSPEYMRILIKCEWNGDEVLQTVVLRAVEWYCSMKYCRCHTERTVLRTGVQCTVAMNKRYRCLCTVRSTS